MSGCIARLTVDGKLEWVGKYNEWSFFEGSAVDFDSDCNLFAMGFNGYDHEMCLVKMDMNEYP